MTAAPKIYPNVIQPQRWARNGLPPDVGFLRQLVRAQNHIMAYRRKCFARWGNVDTIENGTTGAVVLYRFRCHVGYGATHIAFRLGIARDNSGFGVEPSVTITATIAGGASTAVTIYRGADNTGTDSPDSISDHVTKIAVTANTTYEVKVETADFARIAWFGAHEIAATEVDDSVDYFHELAPGIDQPVVDSIRERILAGMTAIYKRNGPHLYSFLGSGNGTNPSFTGTTWTNIIDGTTTSTGEAAGIYVNDVGGGGPPCAYRYSDSSAPAFGAILAVHGQVTAGGTGGEVRFYDDAEGVIATITGITTVEQWHTTAVSVSSLDTIGKLVVQARHSTALNTVRIDAVSLYAYET